MVSALLDTLKAIAACPVLIVGDVMLDRFIYGDVDRISPESPVPVLNIRRESQMLGGAGNALASLVGLKTKARILSVIGDDENGRALCALVEALGVDADGLLVDPERPTTQKSRFLAGHQQLLRADFEKKQALSGAVAQEIVRRAKVMIPQVKAVVVSDYGKGLLTPDILRAIIETANSVNVPVIIDPKGRDYGIYRGAAAVTPNKKELSEAVHDGPTETDAQIVAAAQTLIDECGIGCVFATRSKDGITIVEKAGPVTHLPTHALEVYDVSGAGDVVIATLAGAIAAGASMAQAGALANIAGGIAVSKVGTTPIRADEIAQALQDDQYHKTLQNDKRGNDTDRIRQGFVCAKDGWDDALDHVQRWRARGLRVGFTNGCFDILHFGHVSYLNQARAECDRLIVGLNTDASVRQLKGPERPVHDELSRAAVLSALGAVDMVVLFGGDTDAGDQTANALLEKLQPDLYMKGGDYKVDDIPETPIVKAYGGQVKVLSVFEGHSTTASIKKMRSHAA